VHNAKVDSKMLQWIDKDLAPSVVSLAELLQCTHRVLHSIQLGIHKHGLKSTIFSFNPHSCYC
jgi:hypothetical protein